MQCAIILSELHSLLWIVDSIPGYRLVFFFISAIAPFNVQ